jgi:nitroreductase
VAENILSKAPKTNYVEELKPVSWEAFDAILQNRRSVRVYKNEAIEDEIVQKCLNAALLAPNSSNLQPWEFYWAKSDEAKKEIAKICLSQPAATTAPVLIACVARTKTWKQNRAKMLAHFKTAQDKGARIPSSAISYYEKLVPIVYTQGIFGIAGFIKRIIIFFRGLKTPTPREPVSENDMKLWAVKSTSLACQNLMMAFSAAGLDSCPMEGYDSSRLKKYLKLSSDAVPVMVISAGRRDANGIYGSRVRFDKNEFIKTI